MSDVMLYGILRMPYEMAMESEISRRQFYSTAQQAADRVERADSEIAGLRDRIDSIDLARAGAESNVIALRKMVEQMQTRIIEILLEKELAANAEAQAQPVADAAPDRALLRAIRDGVPLEEPVSVCKAMMARMPARVVLDKGTGPLAAVHLVNIGVGGWVHNKETATAYAEGFNRGTEWLRSSIIEYADAQPFPAQGDALALLRDAACAWNNERESELDAVMERVEVFLLKCRALAAKPAEAK